MRRSAIDMLIETVSGEMHFDENTNYAKVMNKVCDCDDFLQEQLKDNNELLEVYKKITKLLGESLVEECDAYFKEGFSLGVLLGLEIAGYNK